MATSSGDSFRGFFRRAVLHVVGLVLVGALHRAAPARAQQANEAAEQLYIAKGCLGCHGASGRGGVGPELGRTALSFDAFLAQVRTPRAIMPAFPEEVVSTEDARAIHEYLRGLPPAPARLRRDTPQGEQSPQSCAACHRRLNPTIVAQFEAGAMGRAGTQNARVVHARREFNCADCHGTNHTTISASKGRVAEIKCGECHAQIYKEHVLDLGHSYGPGPGDLGPNW
ncbi:MAG: cytochrome c, partial [Gemmatimonadetes bacterium]|nr:cytochrome c [Gemmatimonadota bacterium]